MPKSPTSRRSRPPSAAARRRGAKAAFTQLLEALGATPRGILRDTAARAAALWADYLLAGEGADLAAIIGRGMPTTTETPVSVFDIGAHLVCPHHLTVAFGHAHVAYAPQARLLGLGTISELVRVCTARLVLQEDAGNDIATALVQHLGAHAAVVLIDAVHPCHNVPHPRSHNARTVSWGAAGDAARIRELKSLVLAGWQRSPIPAGEP